MLGGSVDEGQGSLQARSYSARLSTGSLRVLDMGCGQGWFSRQLAGVGATVVGIMHVIAVDARATAVLTSRSREKLEALLEHYDEDVRRRLVPLNGDIADEGQGQSLVDRAGHLDGAVVSVGEFVSTPGGIVEASRAELQRALDGSVIAHLAAARAIIPALEKSSVGYVTLQGTLAYQPLLNSSGLVSVATAAQAMLARVLMEEVADRPIRLNELVIYASIGWGADEQSPVGGRDIGRYVTYLLSD